MSTSIELKKPVTFATADLRIFEKDAPDNCPICSAHVEKFIYGCECTECGWNADYKEEEEEESEPTRYDYAAGIIIK